jgi:hypothetical protein
MDPGLRRGDGKWGIGMVVHAFTDIEGIEVPARINPFALSLSKCQRTPSRFALSLSKCQRTPAWFALSLSKCPCPQARSH